MSMTVNMNNLLNAQMSFKSASKVQDIQKGLENEKTETNTWISTVENGSGTSTEKDRLKKIDAASKNNGNLFADNIGSTQKEIEKAADNEKTDKTQNKDNKVHQNNQDKTVKSDEEKSEVKAENKDSMAPQKDEGTNLDVKA